MTKKLRHGSLFSGVGGVDLGLQWAGYQSVWHVEISPFSRKILDKHWSHVPKFTDVRECGKHNLEPVDIISGGFPCQQISCAGRRDGIGTAESPTERSGLWFEQRRIIAELRPQWVLIENVSRLLETADGETVLEGLEEIGYSWWPQILDAGALGAPHRRERAWILCHDNAQDPCDFEAVIEETGALPPECQQRMEEALGRWNYWKSELGRGAAEGCPAITTTPTATAVLEAQWPGRRIYQNSEGRWRKRSKQGVDGSASWSQEMLVRAVRQRNPRLVPTPEACEEFLGFPRGWTRLTDEATGLPEELAMEREGESDADAYTRILRGVQQIPDWSERVRALGNSVVVQVPMLIGACIQRYESRIAGATHAWAAGTTGDDRGGNLSVEGIPGPQNSRHLSPVGRRYDTLGVEGTRKVYTELNAALEGLAGTVVRTMEEIVPYLARMQALLSQRGADRKMVLKKAGLPTWTKWAEGYAASLHCTLRTIQRHILLVREDHVQRALGPGSAAEKGAGGSGVPKQARLDARQQAALVRAQMVANDLATALRDGTEWDPLLAEFERVGISHAVLEAWSDASSRQPDWRTALVKLVDALEPVGESLPPSVRSALRATEALLGGWTGTLATGNVKETPVHGVRSPASVPEREQVWRGMPISACVPGTTT